ncbi:hypothetical protein AB0I10_26470 [Streptomyces sp. NPDC050636]|uniref:hypothetical protein n=1 Tax=Streptomyces sp. NPDC050636 TaxID=3154510 RepID=UPI00343FE228
MQLDDTDIDIDIDLGNRRIIVGGHVRPLDDLTRRAVLDWLDHRRSHRPDTVNPHLLITQKTAVELGPAGRLWTTRATRNLTTTLERLRADRQLEEALTHGAAPLHLALVFGIDEKAAIRYADSARKFLGPEPETWPRAFAMIPQVLGSVDQPIRASVIWRVVCAATRGLTAA